jgi:tetratricopeptide (TPR) repeat protein
MCRIPQFGRNQNMTLSPILSLARSGSITRAWKAFVAAGLEKANAVESLTLKGRLLKDRARQAVGAERAGLFAQSGAAYRQAATLRPDSYPLINAAAMALFAGDEASASSIARDALTLIDADPSQGETPYWREATRAEALLLLGRETEAKASLAAAIKLAPHAWEDHASTLRQFAAILSANGGGTNWLDPHRPAPQLHYSGTLGISPEDDDTAARIWQAIDEILPGSAYGALAAGADIIAAEAIATRGVELHIVLPADPADFALCSVAPFGEAWLPRYEAMLEAATSVTICGEISRAGVALAEYRAMGMAAERAGLLETHAVALRIEPEDRAAIGGPRLGSGRTVVHVPVSAGHASGIAQLPDGQLTWLLMLADDAGVAEPLGFVSLVELLEAIPPGDCTAAIDLRLDSERDGLSALLQNAAPGTIIATTAAAMALIAEGCSQRAEPLGEMETVDGATGVYAIMLARPG